MQYEDLIERIISVTKRNISQTELANVLGEKVQTINNRAKRNSKFSIEEVAAIEKALNVDLFKISTNDDCVEVKHIGIKPQCGTGSMVEYEPLIRTIKLNKDLISYYLKCSRVDNLKAFTAQGDSMSQTIEDGDLLLVDIGRLDLQNSGVFIFTVNNDWRCKRLNLKIDGSLDIISDNDKYGIETLQPTSSIEIVIKGRVIKNLSRGL